MSVDPAAARAARHSPCIGVCQVDDATGVCKGCARSSDEIAGWLAMSEGERDAVWARLPERIAALSLRVRLLPFTPAELLAWVAETIDRGQGAWVTGVPGALAEFPCATERYVETVVGADSITARSVDAAFRLRVSDKLRAFSFSQDGPVVLGLPRRRATIATAAALTALGPDIAAIDVEHRDHVLFDFGLGRASSRFCVRSGRQSLSDLLTVLIGRHWSEVLTNAGKSLLAESPHRVVESAAARIEVYAPIPMPGADPPLGAHTHFLPAFLKSGEEIPASLALPDYALPVAIFYPGPV